MANYDDDTTPYVCGEDLASVIKLLEKASKIVFDWFKSNQMKGNESKYVMLYQALMTKCM